MVLQYLRPSEIRFTQDSIAGRFQDGGLLNDTIYNIQKGLLSPDNFPHINVVRKNGKLYSFDNRRLYIFRVCEYEGIIEKIPVRLVESWRLREDRFTTENDGVTLRVRQGGTKQHYRKPWLQELDDRGNRNLPPSTSNYVVKHNQIPTIFGNIDSLQSHKTGYTNHDYIPYPEVKTSTKAPTAQSSNLNARTNIHQNTFTTIPDTHRPTTRKKTSRSSSLRSELSKYSPKQQTSRPKITPAPRKARKVCKLDKAI
uniref:uncharacterized protein LOC120347904 n=1 Tax=Styela clava TaxID=7725 RepID=UPI001939DD2C|nr:uncharacterized protein LOC120347904 [Styela clava]